MDQWRQFKPGQWNRSIDVRNFIQQNYAPYEGGLQFFARVN